jgi:hypothetical protein
MNNVRVNIYTGQTVDSVQAFIEGNQTATLGSPYFVPIEKGAIIVALGSSN